MERKYYLLSILAILMCVGIIQGYRSDKTELELCKRQASKRLTSALEDPNISKERWDEMLHEEMTFLNTVAMK